MELLKWFVSILSMLQENPSEEDAAVVDKIMSSRIVKNEVGLQSLSLMPHSLIPLFVVL